MSSETDPGTSNAGGSLGWSVEGSPVSQLSLRPIIPTEMMSSDTSVESSHEAGQGTEDDLPVNPRSLINRDLKAELRDKQSVTSDGVDASENQ